jgi:hypothetical protein
MVRVRHYTHLDVTHIHAGVRREAELLLPRTDPAGHGDPLMSASEWIAAPGVRGSDGIAHDGPWPGSS